jgi:hypothetical protein
LTKPSKSSLRRKVGIALPGGSCFKGFIIFTPAIFVFGGSRPRAPKRGLGGAVRLGSKLPALRPNVLHPPQQAMSGAGCRKPLLAGCWAACKLEGVIGDVGNAKGAVLRRGKQIRFSIVPGPWLIDNT